MTVSLDDPPYPAAYLAMMLFGLSSMLDSGNHDDMTVDDVVAHAKNGDLLEFLKQEAGGSFAMNVADANPSFGRWYAQQLAENCRAIEGREWRKYGIKRRGLCLLISYTAEVLQTNQVPLRLTNHSREAA